MITLERTLQGCHAFRPPQDDKHLHERRYLTSSPPSIMRLMRCQKKKYKWIHLHNKV